MEYDEWIEEFTEYIRHYDNIIDEQKVLDRLNMEKDEFEQLKLEFKCNNINMDLNEQMKGIKIGNDNKVTEDYNIDNNDFSLY